MYGNPSDQLKSHGRLCHVPLLFLSVYCMCCTSCVSVLYVCPSCPCAPALSVRLLNMWVQFCVCSLCVSSICPCPFCQCVACVGPVLCLSSLFVNHVPLPFLSVFCMCRSSCVSVLGGTPAILHFVEKNCVKYYCITL